MPSTDQLSRRPPHRKKCLRTSNCFIGRHPGTSSTFTGGPFVFSNHTKAAGLLGSRRPLHELPLTPTYRCLRLESYHARGNWTAAEWNQVVFNDESRFNLSSDDNRVRVWLPRGERLNPVFALQQHTASTAGVMVWRAIGYNTRSPLVLIRGTMTALRYVLDILKHHMCCQSCNGSQESFFNKTMLGLTRQGCHKIVSALLLPFLGLSDPHICLQSSISGIIWDG
ncbi:transposable element Tcb1 transposase [Trichonephila clavipes]|nr:transposable element Tcb1 transposase [Trichonephila clavipes]